MTFVEWVSRHNGKDTPLGDLAYDISRDKSFPTTNSREDIIAYLNGKHACDEAISTFKTAWKSYQAYLKNHQ